MTNQLCDFNITTGYRGEIMCDEGYAKYDVVVERDEEFIEGHTICRFCLDRYVSDMTRKGYTVIVTKATIKDT